MPDVYTCPVLSVTRLGHAFMLTMSAPAIAREARPGQFVHIDCGEGLTLRRPISICAASRTESGGDTLTVVLEARGAGTRRLTSVKPGDTLDILGPLGRGFTLPEGRLIILGGGIGMPPMLFAATAASGRATAILGARDASRVILRDEFARACEKVYITTDDGSLGMHGPVTIPLEDLLKSGGYDAVLACGPRVMLKAAADICEQYGVPLQVSMEERMGCGVGACLVCACETQGGAMKRVCRDGPVFDAGEVVW